MSDVKRYAAVLNDLAEMRHVGDEQASEYELTSMVCASDYDALAARVADAAALLRKVRRAAIKMGETKHEAWDAALDELLSVAMSDEVSLILIKDALSDADSAVQK